MANDSSDDGAQEVVNSEQQDLEATPLETLERAEKGSNTSQITRQVMTMMRSVGRTNPFVEKMTPEHITKVLDEMSIQGEREYNAFSMKTEHELRDRTASRRYMLAYFIFAAVVLFGIILVFKDDRDLLMQILIPIITAIGGWGVGKAGK